MCSGVCVLAKRLSLRGALLARYLRKSGAPVLAVPIPEEGRSSALFVLKEIAANKKIPLFGPNRGTKSIACEDRKSLACRLPRSMKALRSLSKKTPTLASH
jgi:hypothetical protein